MPKMPGAEGDRPGVGKPRKVSQALKNFKEVASYFSEVNWPDGSPIGNVQLTIRTRGPLVVA